MKMVKIDAIAAIDVLREIIAATDPRRVARPDNLPSQTAKILGKLNDAMIVLYDVKNALEADKVRVEGEARRIEQKLHRLLGVHNNGINVATLLEAAGKPEVTELAEHAQMLQKGMHMAASLAVLAHSAFIYEVLTAFPGTEKADGFLVFSDWSIGHDPMYERRAGLNLAQIFARHDVQDVWL